MASDYFVLNEDLPPGDAPLVIPLGTRHLMVGDEHRGYVVPLGEKIIRATYSPGAKLVTNAS